MGKHQAVAIVVKMLKNSESYSTLMNWEDPHCYSIIMQPFTISPMINMTDIAGSIKRSKAKLKEIEDFPKFIEYSLFTEHPFPFFERYDKETNTQLFIDVAKLTKSCTFDGTVLNFGLGPRSCLGRLFAKEFLIGFFMPIIEHEDKFMPDKNHKYSGRVNDNIFSLKETVYQLKMFCKVITKLVWEKNIASHFA